MKFFDIWVLPFGCNCIIVNGIDISFSQDININDSSRCSVIVVLRFVLISLIKSAKCPQIFSHCYRVFTPATNATAKTLTQAGHVAPRFWVLDIRT